VLKIMIAIIMEYQTMTNYSVTKMGLDDDNVEIKVRAKEHSEIP
jgi:tRNA threonylcarbamoyladenosine modification (KEOPS) complex  Pcc1 subunit